MLFYRTRDEQLSEKHHLRSNTERHFLCLLCKTPEVSEVHISNTNILNEEPKFSLEADSGRKKIH